MIDASSLSYRSIFPCRSVAKKQVGKTNPFRCCCSQSYSRLTLMEKAPAKERLMFPKRRRHSRGRGGSDGMGVSYSLSHHLAGLLDRSPLRFGNKLCYSRFTTFGLHVTREELIPRQPSRLGIQPTGTDVLRNGVTQVGKTSRAVPATPLPIRPCAPKSSRSKKVTRAIAPKPPPFLELWSWSLTLHSERENIV